MIPQLMTTNQMPTSTGVETLLGSDTQNVNILYQQPQLIPIIEQLIQQEQQKQQQQSSGFSQRSFSSNNPIEIETFESSAGVNRASRVESPSQIYTIQAMPRVANLIVNSDGRRVQNFAKRK